MRIAVLSDIHANLTALKSVLTHCRQNYNDVKIIQLGDFIDYGMRPNEVISELVNIRNNIIVNIKGNHERALLGYETDRFSCTRGLDANNYTKTILNENSLDFINKTTNDFVELDLSGKKILCIHGDLTDIYWGKMTDDEIKNPVYEKYDIVLSAHTHISALKTVINSNKTHKTLFINSGSVGQPRNLNPNAQYCVIDLDSLSVFFHSIPYDIETEQNLYSGQINDYYKIRLRKGV